MNKIIINAWNSKQSEIKTAIQEMKREEFSYELLLKNALKIMQTAYEECYEECDGPSYERITRIDNGDYQGTLVFIVGGQCYQPAVDQHWVTSVCYGSCSGCDTMQGIKEEIPWEDEDEPGYEPKPLPEKVVDKLFTLTLHMIQKMCRLCGDPPEEVC